MKTKDTSYGKFFPLDEGGFPEEYPLEDEFHNHIHKMTDYLMLIKRPDILDEIFLEELGTYYQMGFRNFADHCLKQYNDIKTKRNLG